MLLEALGGSGLAASGLVAWGVRGRSAQLFGRSIWRGPSHTHALALTFDDGPSESTPAVLELLAQFGVQATFFQCGHHARRLPLVAAQCLQQGHEIGNHTDTHPYLFFRSPDFISGQLMRAQTAIHNATGFTPKLFRAPYGVRWFGLGPIQNKLGLLGVMWTCIARDWTLSAEEIVKRVERQAHPGAILCFHDGRSLQHSPDITATLESLRVLIPRWLEQGYEFRTVSELMATSE